MSLAQAPTDLEWQLAHAIAQTLVKAKTDVNELSKAIVYLRRIQADPDAGERFFTYLATLAKQGNKIGHSKQTIEYYASIEAACQTHLSAYASEPEVLLQILGWAARLFRYYKSAGPIGEIEAPQIESVRQRELAEFAESQSFKVGQQLAATVTAIRGSNVTCEIAGIVKLSPKEPKKAKTLKEGQAVTVEILKLRDDGNIQKIKIVDDV